MKNSDIYKLAFQCLLSDEFSGYDFIFKNKILSNEDDLLRFIHLASNHLVLPAIYRKLKALGLANELPTIISDHLNDILKLNNERNLRILCQVDEICNALNISGIEPVFMKGTANLLDNLYENKADRMIGDIDFLVKDKDFLNTAEIIINLGYRTDFEIYDDIKTLKDYPRLYRQDVPADIEIHRLPVIPEYQDWFGPDVIFNEKKKIPRKPNCYVPSDKHKLIQNFIHSQLSNKGHKLRFIALRDLFDCHLLIKRINKYEVLKDIKEKKKAEIYFSFAESDVISSNLTGTEIKCINFITNHNWFLNHPRTHYIYIKLYKTYELVTNRFLKAFVNKTVFLNLMIRLKKREWWKKRLFKGLKDYFS